MLGVLFLISAIAVIAKCAEMEGRSAPLWGTITFIVCIGCSVIPLPFVNIVIGFFLSFMLLFAVKVISGDTVNG